MNYKVIVSEQAERDLESIYSYIFHELKSKTSAEKMALRLRGAMIGLSRDAKALSCISNRTLAF